MTKEKGFTLTETMVVVVVFSAVMSLALLTFLGSIRSQRTALNRQRLIAETSYVLGYMERELRNGSDYNYSNGVVSFTDSDDGDVEYRKISDRVVEKRNDAERDLFSSAVKVKGFFADVDDGGIESEKITVVLKTEMKVGEDEYVDFKLQTTVISR